MNGKKHQNCELKAQIWDFKEKLFPYATYTVFAFVLGWSMANKNRLNPKRRCQSLRYKYISIFERHIGACLYFHQDCWSIFNDYKCDFESHSDIFLIILAKFHITNNMTLMSVCLAFPTILFYHWRIVTTTT